MNPKLEEQSVTVVCECGRTLRVVLHFKRGVCKCGAEYVFIDEKPPAPVVVKP